MPADKFADEVGDVLWYIAELASGMSKSMEAIAKLDFEQLDQDAAKHPRKNMRTIVTRLSKWANQIDQELRRNDFTGIKRRIRWILKGCAYIAWNADTDLQSVARRNIKKLKKRYPDGFDAAISMRRYE